MAVTAVSLCRLGERSIAACDAKWANHQPPDPPGLGFAAVVHVRSPRPVQRGYNEYGTAGVADHTGGDAPEGVAGQTGPTGGADNDE